MKSDEQKYERIDYHFHKNVEYKPKTMFNLTFIAKYDKVPEGGDGSSVKNYSVITDAFFNDVNKVELYDQVGRYVKEKLEHEGYIIKSYDAIGACWCNPQSFAANLCNIMQINGLGFHQDIFDKAKSMGERVLNQGA